MNIYESISTAIKDGRSVAVCTVVETKGSVPRHAGSKMLVYDDGTREGTVGGGGVEEISYNAAKEALLNGKPRMLELNLNQDQDNTAGLCGGQVKIFIEPLAVPAQVIIFGAGHVGKAIAHLAKWLNFRVIVSDDREGACDPALVPDADVLLTMAMEDTLGHVNIDHNTCLIVVTRGADVDIKGLPELLKTNAGYIGVMGSRKRWDFTRKSILAAGVPEESIKRIKSPIGIHIHAETPGEIAVSIMAEIIAWQNQPRVDTRD